MGAAGEAGGSPRMPCRPYNPRMKQSWTVMAPGGTSAAELATSMSSPTSCPSDLSAATTATTSGSGTETLLVRGSDSMSGKMKVAEKVAETIATRGRRQKSLSAPSGSYSETGKGRLKTKLENS